MNIELSDQAQQALDADGSILVLGGPGSGKTTLALLKAQRLIPELLPGQEILFLSFSRAAVRQVVVRCQDILTSSERRCITVRTYHAFCMDLLKAHGRLLTGKPPRIVYPAAARLAESAYDGDWETESQRLARSEGLYCFGQFAASSVELLSRAACVLELISGCFPVIILDEFQDTDNAQWQLVKLLSVRSRLITLADRDQRIFEYDPRVDPERLNQLREFLHLAEFDLGHANHRSPDASILGFADAVLHNEQSPQTSDVAMVSYWANSFKQLVHANVLWIYATLRKKGIPAPTVAVLCRTNALVADISALLHEAHTLNGTDYPPLEHHVAWDSELTTAAAQVVASILEWPEYELREGAVATFEYLANYFDLKSAGGRSQGSRSAGDSYRNAAAAVREGREPRTQVGKQLLEAAKAGIVLQGKVEVDWLEARKVIAEIPKLKDVFTSARFVRLFRATDEIGGALGQEWLNTGSYGRAADAVRRALEARQLISANTEPTGVVLMTMHKAKGKEFDGVVIVEGQHKGIFFDSSRESEPFDASRRLLRVAITRARHRVCIVRPNNARALTDCRQG